MKARQGKRRRDVESRCGSPFRQTCGNARTMRAPVAAAKSSVAIARIAKIDSGREPAAVESAPNMNRAVPRSVTRRLLVLSVAVLTFQVAAHAQRGRGAGPAAPP